MGCPGLWKYTAEPSLKRLPVSRIDLMFRNVFPCAKPYPYRRARTLERAAREPGCSRARLCCTAEPCGVQSITQAEDVLAGSTGSWGEANTFLLAPLDWLAAH